MVCSTAALDIPWCRAQTVGLTLSAENRDLDLFRISCGVSIATCVINGRDIGSVLRIDGVVSTIWSYGITKRRYTENKFLSSMELIFERGDLLIFGEFLAWSAPPIQSALRETGWKEL
jgi:hypothetical protein